MTISSLVIRPITDIDYYNAACMHVEAWVDCYKEIFPAGYRDKYSDPTSRMHEYRVRIAQGRTVLVAELISGSDLVDALVGIAIFGTVPIGESAFGSDPTDPDRVEIEGLYVHPDWQRARIGECLLHAVLAARPTAVIVLDCVRANQKGRNFWKKNGFRVIGEGTFEDSEFAVKEITEWSILERDTSVALRHNLSLDQD